MELQSVDMLDMLEQMVNGGKRSLVSNRVSVDKDEMLELIYELKNVLPDEIVQANAYYKESRGILESAHNNAEKILQKARDDADACLAKAQKEANTILADAHNDADLIVKEAEARQLQLIDENAITVRATEQARSVVEDANAKAREIRKGTREYMDGKLLELSDFLAKMYNEVEANRKGL